VPIGRRSALALTARCRALLAAADGDEPAALAAVDEALAFYPDAEFYPFDRARTLLIEGQILRRFRRKAPAKQALGLARDAFQALGSPGWIERVDSEIARLGLRAPAPAGVTATELRVAELTAKGMSARDVAGALFLSPRTVEAHLGRVYKKLGIRSRAELGTRLAALAKDPDSTT
jgi:DNA-binding CsgD family transcriptional regulator